ncbi:MAG: type I restriction enzyme HsdR N-terminal domain-containing protein [Saprospiraceae bacterium]|nr:type I restriction enzyme HsdR N-terminal domain-containing protein [Saprospiraceae bacterium]
MKLNLDLLALSDQLRIQRKENTSYIWDTQRRKFLVLTPEEIVRQLLMIHLIQKRGFNPSRLSVEKMIKVNGMVKRCDILIYDAHFLPWMLVECKAASVKISETTFRQIAIYNLPLRVPYLLVCNGPDAYCCAMNYETESYTFLKQLPSFGESPIFGSEEE